MADKNVSIDIIAADRTRAAFESVKRGLGEVDSKLSMVKGTIGAFAASAAIAGLTQVVTASVNAAAKAEDSSKRLDAVLRATGDTVGFTRAQLDKMADSLAKATTFDDEGVRDAMSVLTKFGRLHGDVFAKALRLSADYAAFTGGDMAEAAQAVGKALADPVNGASMLERQFGKLTAAQDASIKKFVEQGNIAGAQGIIFKKLESSIGGTAGEMNAGLTGKIRGAGKAWDELLESIGKSRVVKQPTEVFLDGLITRLEKMKKTVDDGSWASTLMAIMGKVTPLGAIASALPNAPRTTGPSTSGAIGGTDQRSPEERAAQERAARAQAAEAAAAIRAANEQRAAELNKARLKAADELMDRQIETEERGDKELAAIRENSRKEEDLRLDAFAAANLARYEADAQLENAAAQRGVDLAELAAKAKEDEKEKYKIFTEDLALSLMTDDELRRHYYEKDFNMLQEGATKKHIESKKFYELQGKLVTKNSLTERQTELGKHAALRAMQMQTWQLGTELLQALPGQSKASALAVIVISKGLAIAQVIASTSVAMMRAMAELGPIAGPPVSAGIATMGKIQMGIIAATGLLQAGSVAGGGGGGGGAVGTFSANPSTGLPESSISPSFERPVSPITQSQALPRREVFIHLEVVGRGLLSTDQVHGLIDQINEAQGDGVRITYHHSSGR